MQRCPVCNSFYDDNLTMCPNDGSALVLVQVEPQIADDLKGRTINGRYTVGNSIGEGGMGMVYRAFDQRLGKDVALKVLHKDVGSDERTVRRFFSEARVLSSLDHENIIHLYDFGRIENDGQLFISMELLSGYPVDEVIAQGEVTQELALQIIDQTAAALSEAHLQGVIHRDLKPANLFVTQKDDGKVHVTVLDFGIAKIAGSGQNLTATGKVMGTPSYMSPEQIRGEEPDPRADIYALGAMGYELLSGAPPFMADGPIAVLFMHLEKNADPLHLVGTPEPVSSELSSVITRLMAKKTSDRPRNMKEVRNLLAPILGREVEQDPVDHFGLGDIGVVPLPEAPEPSLDLAAAPETDPAPALLKPTPTDDNPLQQMGDREPEAFQRPERAQEGGAQNMIGVVLVALLVLTALAIGGYLFFK